jgi:carbamate kinase
LRKKETILIALGGNALIRKGQEGTVAQQFENLRRPVRQIARLSLKYNIIITHGNGPQVGNLLLQQESCKTVPALPLEILVAQTQGQIGYMIESSLDTGLMELGIHDRPLVTLITYVVVDENDPAFGDYAKPIGPVLTEQEAAAAPYPVRKTIKGYRRVAASPEPVTIVEKREIKRLIQTGFIVICCGGGGIPVIREERAFHGVDAVIDKDLASAKLAEEVGADILVIATDVPGVAINYGTPDEKFLDQATVTELSAYIKEGHFPKGSMGPKVESLVRFLNACGNKKAVIASVDHIEAAAAGESGTRIFPG